MVSKNNKKRAEMRLPAEEDPEFQIAPMIDILLVLLVFFMSISSTEVLQKTEGVNLPVAKDAKPVEKGAGDGGQTIINILWVELANKGELQIDEVKFEDAQQIVPMLTERVKASSEMRIMVRADRMARYEYIRNVLKAAGASGVKNVTFSVVDKDVPPAAK